MIDLASYQARICLTAAGLLIYNHKVLLVKHKKLSWWLCPGGHQESNELLYQTAEREFFEETGIKVRAISAVPLIDSSVTQYIPVPFVANLHWISRENYEARIHSNHPEVPHSTALWPKGCEQHFGASFLVQPIGGIKPKYDPKESDGIEWFCEDKIDTLETTDAIKSELHLAFSLTKEMVAP